MCIRDRCNRVAAARRLVAAFRSGAIAHLIAERHRTAGVEGEIDKGLYSAGQAIALACSGLRAPVDDFGEIPAEPRHTLLAVPAIAPGPRRLRRELAGVECLGPVSYTHLRAHE